MLVYTIVCLFCTFLSKQFIILSVFFLSSLSSLPSVRSRRPMAPLRISLFVPSPVTWEIREVVSRCLPPGVFSETPSPSVGDFHHPSFIPLGSWISLIPARARSSTTHFVLNRVTTLFTLDYDKVRVFSDAVPQTPRVLAIKRLEGALVCWVLGLLFALDCGERMLWSRRELIVKQVLTHAKELEIPLPLSQ